MWRLILNGVLLAALSGVLSQCASRETGDPNLKPRFQPDPRPIATLDQRTPPRPKPNPPVEEGPRDGRQFMRKVALTGAMLAGLIGIKILDDRREDREDEELREWIESEGGAVPKHKRTD